MRTGLLIAGVVLLVLGLIISVVPRTEAAHYTNSTFGASSGTWSFSNPIHIPGGVIIRMAWASNRVVTIAIATEAAANVVRNNPAASLQTVGYGSGQNSDLTVTIPQGGATCSPLALGRS